MSSVLSSKVSSCSCPHFFIDVANLIGDHLSADFRFLRTNPAMYFNARTTSITLHRTDVVLCWKASFSFYCHPLISSVRLDITLGYISKTSRISHRHWNHYKKGYSREWMSVLYSASFQHSPTTVLSGKVSSCSWNPFFIHNANLIDDHRTAAFWILRGKPATHFNDWTSSISLHHTDGDICLKASFCSKLCYSSEG